MLVGENIIRTLGAHEVNALSWMRKLMEYFRCVIIESLDGVVDGALRSRRKRLYPGACPGARRPGAEASRIEGDQ